MMRKDILIAWLPGDNYAIEGVAKDVTTGKTETYYGNKIDAVLYLVKALFYLLHTHRFPIVNIIVIGHELTKEGVEE